MNRLLIDLIRVSGVSPRGQRLATQPSSYSFARLLVVAFLLALGGCASIPPDHGRGNVDQLLIERGMPVDDKTSNLVSSLIAVPLTSDSAVRVALLNNAELQSVYASLGFGAADIYEAGRIRNPVLSASLLNSSRPDERDQATFGLVTSFTDLVTLSARKRLAEGSFAAMQQVGRGRGPQDCGADRKGLLRLCRRPTGGRTASQIARAGGLSADWLHAIAEAGNLTSRELALERAAASQAQLALWKPRMHPMRPARAGPILGLSSRMDWTVPAQLPLPVAQEDELEDLLLTGKKPGWTWRPQGHRPGCERNNWESSTGRGGWANWI